MGVRFTKEQQQVIDLRNRNILVSAAAGSGKTAVLVERIITRLTKDASPLNVDQLLIVTFTEAAASKSFFLSSSTDSVNFFFLTTLFDSTKESSSLFNFSYKFIISKFLYIISFLILIYTMNSCINILMR